MESVAMSISTQWCHCIELVSTHFHLKCFLLTCHSSTEHIHSLPIDLLSKTLAMLKIFNINPFKYIILCVNSIIFNEICDKKFSIWKDLIHWLFVWQKKIIDYIHTVATALVMDFVSVGTYWYQLFYSCGCLAVFTVYN